MTQTSLSEEAIFLAALDRPTRAERAAYVEEACAGNDALRLRVHELLASHDASRGPLDEPPVALGATSDVSAERPGTQIGPYKLIETIGEGGMGTVWMAQQSVPVKRLVAVKLIKAGMDSRQVIARFEAERQALALMDHTNIARVLDAGTTPAGRPYFVMDLVRGVPITRYCDEHHLTPRQRLELFIPVCQAIQHAHQKGIIHRDLKPSNVLVALYDGKPVPKVIDFGVAKATGQSLTDKTLVTGFGNIVGTLEYMSPEQAEINQLDIDTRSDIYSLGVLLYELLTGSTPFSRKELEKAGMLELLRVIREEEPSKPSTKLSTAEGLPTLAANRGTEPAKLTKLVRGELDWIVMKALEKDRSRRYETANGFAADVQRYLADEAVQACPPSAWYRFGKFARRNQRALAAAALLTAALMVAVGAVAGSIGWVAREQATQRTRTASEVTQFLQRAESLYDENKLPEAVAEIEKARGVLGAGGGDDDLVQRVQRWDTDLEMTEILEEIRLRAQDQNDTDRQIADLARAFREYGINVEASPSDATATAIASSRIKLDFFMALGHWIGLERNEERRNQLIAVLKAADSDPWRARLRQASVAKDVRTLREMAAEVDPSAIRTRYLEMLGNALRGAGDKEAAVDLLRRAQQHHTSDYLINATLARCLSELKPPPLEEVLAFRRAALVVRPKSPWARNSLGFALERLGRMEEAATEYREAIRLQPRNAVFRTNLGNVLREQNKYDEAFARYREAIEIDPEYSAAYEGRSFAYEKQSRPAEAQADFQKAVELAPKSALVRCNFGLFLRRQNRLDEAIEQFQVSLKLDPSYAFSHYVYGKALGAQSRLDRAAESFEKAIALDPKNVDARINLGVVFANQQRPEEAAIHYRKALELDSKSAVAHAYLGNSLIAQCEIENEAGYVISPEVVDQVPQLAAAQPKLREAAEHFRTALAFDPCYDHALNGLGRALRLQAKLDEAVTILREAVELFPKDVFLWFNLGLVHRDLEQYEEAVTDFTKVIELQPEHDQAWWQRHEAYQGNWNRALADYTKATEFTPGNAAAWYFLGRAKNALKLYDQAVADYTKAIELRPDYSLALIARGGVYAKHLNQYEQAISDYSKIIELGRADEPVYHWTMRELVEVYKVCNQWDKAIAELARASDRELALPADVQFMKYRNQLAWVLATCPDPKYRDGPRAVEAAKKYLDSYHTKKFPGNEGGVWNTLGVAHYRAGDYPAAETALKKSMELRMGGDSFDWFFLAAALWQQGKERESREWYDKAVEWMNKNKPEIEELRRIQDEELGRFQAEVADLLGIARDGQMEVAPSPPVEQ